LRTIFFDVDHTLLRGSSAQLATRVMARRGLIRRRHVFRALFYVALHRMGRAPVDVLFREAAATFRGLHPSVIREVADETFRVHVRPRLYADGERLVTQHLEKGDRVVLISAGPDLVIQALADHLGAQGAIGSSGIVGPDGYLTGECLQPYCYGPGKVALAERFLGANRPDGNGDGGALASCGFYSDSITDLPLLSRVAEPCAVNPDRALRKVAAERRWRIVDLQA
jgi:HAD superfamily hydrolase (TIGR01490 family)